MMRVDVTKIVFSSMRTPVKLGRIVKVISENSFIVSSRIEGSKFNTLEHVIIHNGDGIIDMAHQNEQTYLWKVYPTDSNGQDYAFAVITDSVSEQHVVSQFKEKTPHWQDEHLIIKGYKEVMRDFTISSNGTTTRFRPKDSEEDVLEIPKKTYFHAYNAATSRVLTQVDIIHRGEDKVVYVWGDDCTVETLHDILSRSL